MEMNYIIPLDGLACGKSHYEWVVDKQFFDSFDNTEVLDAELVAKAIAEKSGMKVKLDCSLRGSITVACDRCLEAVEMPVDTEFRLTLQYNEEESGEPDRELILLTEDNPEYDLSQILYDYACLALPIQRTHRDGECNPQIVKYLLKEDGVAGADDKGDENPFAALKGMFEN